MKKAFNTLSSHHSPFNLVKQTLGAILISSIVFISNHAIASKYTVNSTTTAKVIDSKAVFNQAIEDYLSGRYKSAQAGYQQLKNTDYAAVSAVPTAINLVALKKYSQAKKAFGELKLGTDLRTREYAQLWELWLTAKQWKGSNKALNKELKRLVDTQTWHLPYEKSIAALYAGRESVESVFNAVSAFNADAVLQQDALTEATFFAGGYLQNVKRDSASARQLFNENLNKLYSVSLERPLIDRECASLNKLSIKSK